MVNNLIWVEWLHVFQSVLLGAFERGASPIGRALAPSHQQLRVKSSYGLASRQNFFWRKCTPTKIELENHCIRRLIGASSTERWNNSTAARSNAHPPSRRTEGHDADFGSGYPTNHVCLAMEFIIWVFFCNCFNFLDFWSRLIWKWFCTQYNNKGVYGNSEACVRWALDRKTHWISAKWLCHTLVDESCLFRVTMSVIILLWVCSQASCPDLPLAQEMSTQCCFSGVVGSGVEPFSLSDFWA